jgi:ankyrin repeat protein
MLLLILVMVAISCSSKTPLIRNAWCCDTRRVIKLLEKGADVNATDKWGTTALMEAVRCKDPELVKILIDAGADVNARDFYGYVALHIAVDLGLTEIVKYLLNAGADVNVISEANRKAALRDAIERDHDDIVKLLLEAGADVNVKSGSGSWETPLHSAAERCNTNVVKLLLEKGADPNAKDERGDTPLIRISDPYRGNILLCEAVVRVLLDAGALDVSTEYVEKVWVNNHTDSWLSKLADTRRCIALSMIWRI